METETVAVMIPVTAIVFGLSIPIVYAITDYRKRRRLIELHHAERMAAIERGMELPPLPVDILGGAARRRTSSELLPGLVWLFVGVGLVAALGPLTGQRGVALLGLIPAGVGLAYLIYYAVEGRKVRGTNGVSPSDSAGDVGRKPQQ